MLKKPLAMKKIEAQMRRIGEQGKDLVAKYSADPERRVHHSEGTGNRELLTVYPTA